MNATKYSYNTMWWENYFLDSLWLLIHPRKRKWRRSEEEEKEPLVTAVGICHEYQIRPFVNICMYIYYIVVIHHQLHSRLIEPEIACSAGIAVCCCFSLIMMMKQMTAGLAEAAVAAVTELMRDGCSGSIMYSRDEIRQYVHGHPVKQLKSSRKSACWLIIPVFISKHLSRSRAIGTEHDRSRSRKRKGRRRSREAGGSRQER